MVTSVCLAVDGGSKWPGPYAMGGTTVAPAIYSAPTLDEAGNIYLTVTYGTSVETGALRKFSPAGVPLGRADFPAAVSSPPTLGANGILYFGCYDGRVLAYDSQQAGSANWQPKWVYDSNELTGELTYINSAPAISADGSTLYFGLSTWGAGSASSPGGLLALTSDLQLKWVVWFGDRVESSPVIAADGTIYASSWDGNLYAFNPDKSEKWRRPLNASIFASPAIGPDGTVYVGSIAKQFVAVSPANELKWTAEVSAIGAASVGPDGTVYVGNYADATLCAVNRDDGSVKWRAVGPPSTTAIGSTPTIRGDGLILYGGADRTLRAYRPDTGDVVWSYAATGEIGTAPVIAPTADHSIYLCTVDGKLHALQGNGSGVSQYASWPTFQRDMAHRGLAPETMNGGRLANLSTRGLVAPDKLLIAGFVLKGGAIQRLLVRGVGPTLKYFNLQQPLADPRMEVWTHSAFIWDRNDNWGDGDDAAAIAEIGNGLGAFPLDAGSRDAAVLARFDPALTYTEVIGSADGSTGVALAEVYEIDPTSAGLHNLSTRGYVGTGVDVLIAGLHISGTGKLRLLIRGIGPGLKQFNVPGTIARPRIQVSTLDGTVMAENSGWYAAGLSGDINAATALSGGFPLKSTDADTALVMALSPGSYTVILSGVDGDVGVGMVEVYYLPF
ncbi:PQQ-binding-like beta-propeller repeat protein [Opitutus sp. ER46]|uniref:outer membrane protein assembly factor BamB family protein n=1 Tax=Opitutus sp. ER46 TaxID=2161864 RepID=UPI001304A819|nr:PQQ-binding-like beta-propeller repeat protein [Opitutus sp. ER46]